MKTTFDIKDGYVCVIFRKLHNGELDAKHAPVINGVQTTNYSSVSSQGFSSKDEVIEYIKANFYNGE